MPQPKDLDPYSDARAFYGAELRRLRERAGLTQEQLGERVFCSGTYIGMFESADRRPQQDLSRILDDLFDSGEHLQRLCRLARTSKVADYFADAADLERRARTISEYAPVLVPGLLQTEDYARAITRTTMRFSSPERVEDLVRGRMERQGVLEGERTPVVWEIIHEAVLRSPIGDHEVMARQLRHVVGMATRHHIVVQVLPFTAMKEAFMDSMVSVMSFGDAPSLVYTEGAGSGRLIEEPALVERSAQSYDLARAAALSPADSLDLLASTAEDYAKR
ncbi:Scr1 family TA system antitoxin-like transcriptional regulator [Streptomyces sp. NPDC090029]|uniref:helix-turn-helix domain-containing protein n=1 Tax=Streptomyces sp. NPDC090029 TaxID=3365924 RepID=UPI0038127555